MPTRVINYAKIGQKKRASTLFSLATGELYAAKELVQKAFYKESIAHLYFCSFYLAQATVMDSLKSDSHKSVDAEFNRKYGRGTGAVPKLYVKLHHILHIKRTEFSYRVSHTPRSSDIILYLRHLQAFHKCVDKLLVKVTTMDIINDLFETNYDMIRDFSYDIYCPKTYSHHNRITYWQPPFYISIFTYEKIVEVLRDSLKKLKVKKYDEYVLGLNSKVNQYSNDHYLMLDFDSLDTDVEVVLKEYGGVLLKSGRGFHFIGNKIISGRKEWEGILTKLLRNKELRGKIDRKHIEISISRGYATLRTTESKLKPDIPIFYKAI